LRYWQKKLIMRKNQLVDVSTKVKTSIHVIADICCEAARKSTANKQAVLETQEPATPALAASTRGNRLTRKDEPSVPPKLESAESAVSKAQNLTDNDEDDLLLQAALRASLEEVNIGTTKPQEQADLKNINPFFLTKEQKRLKKLMEDQEKLRLEVEASHKASAEFSKGKTVNPFLQPRKPSQTQPATTGNQIGGLAGYFGGDRTVPMMIPLSYAPWPTEADGHVGMCQLYRNWKLEDVETPFKLKLKLRRLADGTFFDWTLAEQISPIRYTEELFLTRIESEPVATVEPETSLINLGDAIGVTATSSATITIPREVLQTFLESLYGHELMVAPSSKALLNSVYGQSDYTSSPTTPKSADSQVSPHSLLWCDRFKPATCSDILGTANQIVTKYVKEWLQAWKASSEDSLSLKKDAVAKSTVTKKLRVLDEGDDDDKESDDNTEYGDSKRQKKLSSSGRKRKLFKLLKNRKSKARQRRIVDSDSDFVVPDDEFDYESEDSSEAESESEDAKPLAMARTHLRLLGPPGSGRTSTVRAAAEECGYDIIEFHAGQKRTGKDVNSFLSEATRSHAVMAESTSSLAIPGGKAGWASILSAMNAQAKAADEAAAAERVAAEEKTEKARLKAEAKKEKAPKKKSNPKGRASRKRRKKDDSDFDEEASEDFGMDEEIEDDDSEIESMEKTTAQTNKKENGQTSLSWWMGGMPKTTAADRAARAEKRRNQPEGGNLISCEISPDVSPMETDQSVTVAETPVEEPIDSSKDSTRPTKKKLRRSLATEATPITSAKSAEKKEVSTEIIDVETVDPPKRKRPKRTESAPINPPTPPADTVTDKVIDIEAMNEQGASSFKDMASKDEQGASQSGGLQAAKPSLILIEDADVLFDEDKGFWAAIGSLMDGSKRPIIMTSNGE
jgi:hypothetical protein